VTEVKTCGITNLEDAELCLGLGAWAVGLILWPDSPRRCPLERAEEIAASLRRRAEVVGVFVNQPLDEVAQLADRVGLTMLQLHGDEGPAYCREAARRTGCKVMKAVRVKDAAQIRSLQSYSTDYHLLDAYVPGTPGGTGESFNWELAARHEWLSPAVLSGGLRPDNVAEAVRVARPFAVDTASGTEAAPGRKDPQKVEAFFRAVQSADRALAPAG
jgi:phosphoribosylanthranilate isomerase